MIVSFAAIVISAGMIAPGHAQTIQKWVDEKGVTHYGDAPPPEVKSGDATRMKVTPPSEPKARPAPPPAEKAERKSEAVAAIPPAETRAASKGRILLPTDPKDCETRFAVLRNQVRLYREDRGRGGLANPKADAEFDKWAAGEDAWLEQHCGGQ